MKKRLKELRDEDTSEIDERIRDLEEKINLQKELL